MFGNKAPVVATQKAKRGDPGGTTNSLADNGGTGNELKEEGLYNAHSVAKGLPGMKVAFDRLLSASSFMFSCSVSAVVVPSFTRVLPDGEFFSSP